MGRTVLSALALGFAVATLAGPAFADPSPRATDDVPDFGSATLVPSDSDYQITADGYLIYQDDMVVGCESVWPGNYTSTELYEEQAGICTEAGFPPKRPPPSEWVSLPVTGGLPLLLGSLVLLLGAAGLLARAIAPR